MFFQVPSEFSFIQVIDLFFKLHKVFNLDFDKSIMQLMLFFGYFVYGMTNAQNGMHANTKKVAKQLFPNQA